MTVDILLTVWKTMASIAMMYVALCLVFQHHLSLFQFSLLGVSSSSPLSFSPERVGEEETLPTAVVLGFGLPRNGVIPPILKHRSDDSPTLLFLFLFPLKSSRLL